METARAAARAVLLVPGQPCVMILHYENLGMVCDWRILAIGKPCPGGRFPALGDRWVRRFGRDVKVDHSQRCVRHCGFAGEHRSLRVDHS